MTTPEVDSRSDERKRLDELIAAEPHLPPPDLPVGARPRPMQDLLPKARRPVAVLGVVENGVVRPLDPQVKLVERARVIIVAQDPA